MKTKKNIPNSTSTPVLYHSKFSLNTVRKNGKIEEEDVETFRASKIHPKSIMVNDKKSCKVSEKVSLHIAQTTETIAYANSHIYIGNQQGKEIEIKTEPKSSKTKPKEEGKKKTKELKEKTKNTGKKKEKESHTNKFYKTTSNFISTAGTTTKSETILDTFSRKTVRNSKNEQKEDPFSKSKQKMTIHIPDQKDSIFRTTRNTNRMSSKNINKPVQLSQLDSHKEYCIVKGKFIPVESSTDRKRIDQIFAETTSTSPNISYHFPQQVSDRMASTEVCLVDVGIETIQKEISHFEVLVKAAHEDIGIQYSDRLNSKSGGKSQEKENELLNSLKASIHHEENTLINEKSERSTLLETMMQLESLDLSKTENVLLDNLNMDQKRHFREILSVWMQKMKSPRPELLDLPKQLTEDLKEIESLKFISSLTKGKPNFQKSEPELQKINFIQQQARNEEFEQLLMLRESKQTNQLNISLRSPHQIDTSVFSVLSSFEDIFCYVQMNYEDSALHMINSLYGLSYSDKYKFISKFYSLKNSGNSPHLDQMPISKRIQLEIEMRESKNCILNDTIYSKFYSEMCEDKEAGSNETQEMYSYIHGKCIFDCINELTVAYRPFYLTKGDPFPWTLVPLRCLTFYSIDSESLETVMEQIQEKINNMSKSLCGLHIETDMYNAGCYQTKEEQRDWNKDVVFSIRREKLTNVIIKESLKGADSSEDSYLELEIDATCVLQELSILIEQEILNEWVKELAILKDY